MARTKKKPRSHLLQTLNPAQKEAVQHTQGPSLILAGAGSGKTRVLTYRIAYLIEEQKVDPSKIFAVTFTNKAANEMKERIYNLVKDFGKKSWIGTFHSICARILRIEAERLGYGKNFVIYDADDQLRSVKNVMNNLNLSPKKFSPEAILSRIGGAKNSFVGPEEYQSIAYDPFEKAVATVYLHYQKGLKANNAMDFDDLIGNVIELFEKFPNVLSLYQNKFHYILVDEYQDTNRTQYLLLKKLAAKKQNICVVGDDDQSIYKWRGADIQNILNFEKDYPNCKIYHLVQNYRSTKNILDAANSVVKNNLHRHEKSLWTERAAGEKVTIIDLNDHISESLQVVDLFKEELQENGRNFQDIVVLYRTNAQSRVHEDAFRNSGIPYVIVGGVRFYERKEIKDVVAYLRLVCNPNDNISLKRVINLPLRGIGETTVAKIEEFARENSISMLLAAGKAREITTISERIGRNVHNFYELINKYANLKNDLSAGELTRTLVDEIGILRTLKEIGTEESFTRAENIRELLSAIVNSKKKLDAFLEEVALIADIDSWNDSANAVTLMTLHSAKGLEFPVVFITGLEEGLFPLSRSFDNEDDLEEERRLFYVGATRAKEKLYLTWAANRMRFGENFRNVPSMFIKEIDPNLVVRKDMRSLEDYTKPQRKPNVMPAYEDFSQDAPVISIGTAVRHGKFGFGKVVQKEGNGEDMKVVVKFVEAGEKKLLVKYANLELI